MLLSHAPPTRASTTSPNASVGHIHMTLPRLAEMMMPAVPPVTAIAIPPHVTRYAKPSTASLHCVPHESVAMVKSSEYQREPNAAIAATMDMRMVTIMSIGPRRARGARTAGAGGYCGGGKYGYGGGVIPQLCRVAAILAGRISVPIGISRVFSVWLSASCEAMFGVRIGINSHAELCRYDSGNGPALRSSYAGFLNIEGSGSGFDDTRFDAAEA